MVEVEVEVEIGGISYRGLAVVITQTQAFAFSGTRLLSGLSVLHGRKGSLRLVQHLLPELHLLMPGAQLSIAPSSVGMQWHENARGVFVLPVIGGSTLARGCLPGG